MCPDSHAGEQNRATSERSAIRHCNALACPCSLPRKNPVIPDRSRMLVVGEHYAVTDEDSVADGRSFANEGVTLNLASAAYGNIGLDLYKWPYPSVSTDAAAVEIHK